jgi:hypothetical protein
VFSSLLQPWQQHPSNRSRHRASSLRSHKSNSSSLKRSLTLSSPPMYPHPSLSSTLTLSEVAACPYEGSYRNLIQTFLALSDSDTLIYLTYQVPLHLPFAPLPYSSLLSPSGGITVKANSSISSRKNSMSPSELLFLTLPHLSQPNPGSGGKQSIQISETWVRRKSISSRSPGREPNYNRTRFDWTHTIVNAYLLPID